MGSRRVSENKGGEWGLEQQFKKTNNLVSDRRAKKKNKMKDLLVVSRASTASFPSPHFSPFAYTMTALSGKKSNRNTKHKNKHNIVVPGEAVKTQVPKRLVNRVA